MTGRPVTGRSVTGRSVTGPAGELGAFRFLARNPRRVLPAVVVQALVTALVLAVVTPLTGFGATVEANLRPLTVYTAVTPMSRADFDEGLSAQLDANPAQERRVQAKALWMRTPMVVGESFTMLVALRADEHADFLRRVGNRLVEGALPAPGTDGAAIHADVARARHMKVGDAFGRLVDLEDATPGRFTVTGIVDGPSRVGLVDFDYAAMPTFVLSRIESFQIVYAKPGRKAESDAYLNAAKDEAGRPALRVWDEAFWRKRTEKMLENLPTILNAVVGSISVIVALVVVLLALIAFQARSDEFALLLAVGITRRRLAGKVLLEHLLCAGAALLLGLGLGYGFLAWWDVAVLRPKAILIDFFAPYPLALASTLPLVAAAASAAILTLRLRRMDPVAILQRRNA